VKKLAQLNKEWIKAVDYSERERIWHSMLDIYTDQVFSIGIVSSVPQVIVANKKLRNIPKVAIYNWDPGAHFGIYRPDQFWFDDNNSDGINTRKLN
jgi:peptide/nickel transport system substrate-binding protein